MERKTFPILGLMTFAAGAAGVWLRWDRGLTGSFFTMSVVLGLVSLMEWAERRERQQPSHRG